MGSASVKPGSVSARKFPFAHDRSGSFDGAWRLVFHRPAVLIPGVFLAGGSLSASAILWSMAICLLFILCLLVLLLRPPPAAPVG